MIPVFYSKYNLGKNEFFENEIYEGNAINTGLGWQSNKRDFSIYAAFGMSTSNLEGSTISLISGIDVKLFDINICTILLPIRMHIEGEAKVDVYKRQQLDLDKQRFMEIFDREMEKLEQ